MKLIGYFFFLVIIILGVTFSVLNATPVTINYYVATRQIPLSLALVMCFGVGIFLGMLTMSVFMIRLKSKNHRIKKRLKMAEAELNNLRVIPIKEL